MTDPVSGLRFCIPCRKRYPAFQGRQCPVCFDTETFPVEPDVPRQEALFTVPPLPSPNAWIVEWRWKPCDRVKSRWCRPPEGYHPEPPNPWVRLQNYNIIRKTTGIQIAARNRRYQPWKSLRLRAVSWEPTPLLP